MSQSRSTRSKVNDGINELCDKLELTPFVRERCLKMSSKLEKEGGAGLTGSPINALACSIVSIVYEEAHEQGKVSTHISDRTIGKVFGLDSVDVIRSKNIMNSRMSTTMP